MGGQKYRKAALALTTALLLSTCTMPVLAAPYSNTDQSMAAVSSDLTYAHGLDTEARIIKLVELNERSPYANTGIAVTDSYLEIRKKPSKKSDVLGKLYSGSGCEILGETKKWAHIRSGECDGYVPKKNLLTGLDAQLYAEENNITGLVARSQNASRSEYLYKEPSADSDIVATVMWDQDVEIIGETDDHMWVRVRIGKDEGYLEATSIILDVQYEEAVSLEAERAAAEAAARAQAEAQRKAAQAQAQAEAEAKAKAKAEALAAEQAAAAAAAEAEAAAAQETQAPETEAAQEEVQETEAPAQEAQETEAPVQEEVQETEAPVQEEAQETEAPQEEAQETEAPAQEEAPETEAPQEETQAQVTVTDTSEAVYATYDVSIRDGYSTDGAVLDVLTAGAGITRTGICDNGWSRVDYHGSTAYIKSDYLTTEKPAQPEPEPAQTAPEGGSETVYAVADVNIREQASTDADVIGGLTQGQSITRTSSGGGWSTVTINGVTGYINSDFLTTEKPEGAQEPQQQEEAQPETQAQEAPQEQPAQEQQKETSAESVIVEVNETVYATSGVNVRDGAGKDKNKIGSLAAGQSATRTGKLENGWSRVDVGGVTGYVNSDYLTTEKPAVKTEAATTAVSSSDSSSKGQEVANFALQYVGYPYVYGGNSLTGGVDCSGFAQQVYLNFGYSLPRTAAAQSGVGSSVSLNNLQPGDLLFYGSSSYIGHVAIYIGDGKIVHASTPRTGIITSNYNYRSPVCARRIL